MKYVFVSIMTAVVCLSCSTLPEKGNDYSSMGVLKVRIDNPAINILFSASTSGETSFGLGVTFYKGELDGLLLKNLATGEIVRPDYVKDGFCFYANIPAVSYCLDSAVLDEEREIRFSEEGNPVFTVKSNEVVYFGSYTVGVSFGKEAYLKKAGYEEEKKNRKQVEYIVNDLHKKAGWIFR
ncbi:MAG: hypothetical protein JW881_20835 [Spirochaetales bacterium]|nr:hypothetical protein [Spirochaetales bacterium]